MAEPVKTTALSAPVLLYGGAAVTVVGALMPWVSGPFGISASGTSGDGVIALVLGIGVAGFGAVALSKAKAWGRVVSIILALLLCLLMGFEVVHISTAEPGFSLGFGVIVCVIGAAGCTWGAFKARTTPPPTPLP